MAGPLPAKNTAHHRRKITGLPAIRPGIVNPVLQLTVASLRPCNDTSDLPVQRLTAQAILPQVIVMPYLRMVRKAAAITSVSVSGSSYVLFIWFPVIRCRDAPNHSSFFSVCSVALSGGVASATSFSIDDHPPANHSPGSSPLSTCCSQREGERRLASRNQTGWC